MNSSLWILISAYSPESKDMYLGLFIPCNCTAPSLLIDLLPLLYLSLHVSHHFISSLVLLALSLLLKLVI